MEVFLPTPSLTYTSYVSFSFLGQSSLAQNCVLTTLFNTKIANELSLNNRIFGSKAHKPIQIYIFLIILFLFIIYIILCRMNV